jgi:uncharacterized delta-60 repeat protein
MEALERRYFFSAAVPSPFIGPVLPADFSQQYASPQADYFFDSAGFHWTVIVRDFPAISTGVWYPPGQSPMDRAPIIAEATGDEFYGPANDAVLHTELDALPHPPGIDYTIHDHGDGTFNVTGQPEANSPYRIDLTQASKLNAHLTLPDGKLLLFGSPAEIEPVNNYQPEIMGISALARYLPDGNLDTTFGDGGVVYMKGPGDSAYSPRASIWTDPDGTIYLYTGNQPTGTQAYLLQISADGTQQNLMARVNGFVDRGEDGAFYIAQSASSTSLVVQKMLADGTIDNSFGDQGRAVIDTSASPQIYDVKVDHQGRINVAGELDFGTSEPDAGFVARLFPSGAVDTTFGNAGLFVLATPGRSDESFRSIAFNPDNSGIVVGGLLNMGRESGALLVSLDQNGMLVSSFGNAGVEWIHDDNIYIVDRVQIGQNNDLFLLTDNTISGVNILHRLPNGVAIDQENIDQITPVAIVPEKGPHDIETIQWHGQSVAMAKGEWLINFDGQPYEDVYAIQPFIDELQLGIQVMDVTPYFVSIKVPPNVTPEQLEPAVLSMSGVLSIGPNAVATMLDTGIVDQPTDATPIFIISNPSPTPSPGALPPLTLKTSQMTHPTTPLPATSLPQIHFSTSPISSDLPTDHRPDDGLLAPPDDQVN